MYEQILRNEWYQGDVLQGVTFKSGIIGSEEFVTNGIVISQTCDVQRRKFIHICPVISFASSRNAQLAEGKNDQQINHVFDAIRKRSVEYYIHLPSFTGESLSAEESFIDLQLVLSIKPDELIEHSRLYGLSDKGRHVLAFSIMNYYGRPFFTD